MTDLTGRTALVTGASRGLGRAIAERLAADGALVAVHYGSNKAAALATVAAIEAAGGAAFAVAADLGRDDGVDLLFEGLVEGLGDRRLDVLVNNAAVFGPGLDASQDDFDRVFRVNVRSPFFVIQRALPLMGDGGRIVNISSGVTWFAIPEVVYAMTKGALNVLGRSLANLLGGRGITVNTVSPGITRTDMNSWLDEVPGAAEGVASIVALGRVGGRTTSPTRSRSSPRPTAAG
jgi:NAD(P)-dependent dehydrogenase (short-subunit alcohol dehydrogenase family)